MITLPALGHAQVTTSTLLSGTITDSSGAVVPAAAVKVKNDATGVEYNTTTATNGTYTIPSVAPGTYTVTVTAQGFKQAVAQNITVLAAPRTVDITLSVGTLSETVQVVAAAEVLQTQSANVSTTIIGRQITELPFTSRDALDLMLGQTGVTTTGRPRTSSVNGLPQGSINITIDGLNVQDNCLKSTDGFYTYIRPRIDAMEEASISTATPGAESSGEGATQIKFVTRSGSNDFHGSVYWYNRNPDFNANYWYNNRDLAPDPSTGKAPRDQVKLNQPGFRLGGPIWKNKMFFFVNYELYRLPDQQMRQPTLLVPSVLNGNYQYPVGSTVKSVNLLTIAGQNPCPTSSNPNAMCPSTVDPAVLKVLNMMQSSTAGYALSPSTDPNYQTLSFINSDQQQRRFVTTRFDYNITSKHHYELTWNHDKFAESLADFLNGADPPFPGFPNHGTQGGNRFGVSMALRSTLTSKIVNEFRFGFNGGTTLWFPEVNAGQLSYMGSYAMDFADSGAGITNPYSVNAQERRLSPVKQFNDNLTWVRGTHGIAVGWSFSQIKDNDQYSWYGMVPTVYFGLDSLDPAYNIFQAPSTFFPGASQPQLDEANSIYASLIGRVTELDNAYVVDNTGKYVLNGMYRDLLHQRETGFYAQDSWRVKPNLTLNYGLRWEIQFPFHPDSLAYSWTGQNGVWGISGPGNLFMPGTLSGSKTQFNQLNPSDMPWNTDWKDFAPSVGAAWNPSFNGGLLHKLFGNSGQTVLRGGFSIAYDREGTAALTYFDSNPGGSLDATQSIGNGNLPVGTMLRNGIPKDPTTYPSAPEYPIVSTKQYSAYGFDPNIKTGRVKSWTFGLQREISKNTVIEVRYVGNRGDRLWRTNNLNEVNTVQNGFFNEFKLAQQNLLANVAANRGYTFAYMGPNTGTAPLPILLANFSGVPAAQASDPTKYTSSYFKSATYYKPLYTWAPNPVSLATSLIGDASDSRGFMANRAKAGLPANFFQVNPGVNGAYYWDSSGWSSYDALSIELRRALSKGLLVQGSYVFDKALATFYGTGSGTGAGGYVTLQDKSLGKSPSPLDVTHQFKMNWIWELPFGKGQLLGRNAGGVLDKFIGGWELHGIARIQSGTPFNLGNVDLVNITQSQLQSLVGVYKNDALKKTYFLPQSIIQPTIQAANPGLWGAVGPYGNPSSTDQYIAPASYLNCAQPYPGVCGFSRLVLHGFWFERFDISLVKQTRITERVKLEIRGEFLNAFNNINFMVGAASGYSTSVSNFSSTTFGQFANAYRDISTTSDPGGRIVQFVARINF
jgi:hypothetical protein